MEKDILTQWIERLNQGWQKFVKTDRLQTLRLRLEDNICLYIWTERDQVAWRHRLTWETLHASPPN